MPASLTQNPPFHCAKLHVQRGPCSRYVGTHVSALSSLRKRRGARILSPNSERSPHPTPSQWAFQDSLPETVLVQDVPGLRSAVDGGQEGKGKRDREGEGGVASQGHPGLMSGEAENHR